MGRTFVVAVAGSLLFASIALADIPGPPKKINYVDPQVSFQGIEKHPNYVFYLCYWTFLAGPEGPEGTVRHTPIKVKDSNPFTLKVERGVAYSKLLALDRNDFDKRAKKDPSLKWLTDETEGVLGAVVFPPPSKAPDHGKEAPVTTYDVSLKEGKLTVELVPDANRSMTAPAGLLSTLAAGIGISTCLAGLGLWLTRRKGACCAESV